jgi:predicted MFS family arabinose efflux permease
MHAAPAFPWRSVLSALCASLVGIGLARFAYTPLIPPLIEAGWFTPADAAYLGAANLAGYLAGALLGRPIAARASTALALRAMMVLASAAFFACAFPLSFMWFFVWRFAAGLAGGALMVLAATSVLPHVPQARRGLAGGVIFAGVGLGIAASGTLVPVLMRLGLVATWLGLGALAVLLTVVAWRGWPAAAPDVRARGAAPGRIHSPIFLALYAGYALNAVGLVPHMIFLVDFVARGLGQGLDGGAQYWVLFGLGAVAGPVLAGYFADRVGFAAALRIGFVVQAACVALLMVSDGALALVVSSVVIGAFVPGVVPLVLGRVQELLPRDSEAQKSAWSLCTTAFAIGQAAGAYGFSYVFARGGGYLILFALGAGAMLLALAIEVVAALIVGRAIAAARR